MRSRAKRLALFLVLGLCALAPTASWADDDGDQDRARELYERGDIRGLSDVLEEVGERAPGDVVDVQLVQKKDKWLYRIQIVDSAGRRKTLLIPADAMNDPEHGEGEGG